MYEYDDDFDGITQEDAFDREMEARTAQAIDESDTEQECPLTADPFTPEKLHDLIQIHYGASVSMDRVRILFHEYCARNLLGPGVDIYDFVCELKLNDI